MNCDARQESLSLYALDALQGAELQELRAHLQSGCPICEGRLKEAQALAAMLPLTLEHVPPPAGARQRLMDRIAATAPAAPLRLASDRGSERALGAPEQPRRRSWWIPALAGAAAAACVAVLFFANIISSERKALQTARDQLSQKETELQQVQSSATDAQEIKRLITLPGVKVVNLAGTKEQPNAVARLIWDPADRSLRLYATDFKPLPTGKGYELWFFNGGAKPVAAGAFQVDPRGGGALHLTLATDPGSLVACAITDEPYNAGAGMPQPTGAIQLQWGLR